MIFVFYMYFCTPKILFICLDSQIDFNISETCLRVAIREALLHCNLLVLFASIKQKAGGLCEKTGVFKPLRIQLSVVVVSVQIFLQYMTGHESLRLLASTGNSYDFTINWPYL